MAIDLDLNATRDLPTYLGLVTGLDLLEQRLWLRLALHEGEVLSDRRRGLPWVTWLQTRPVPLAVIRSRVRREIEGCPGVLRVDDVTAALSTSRVLTISAAVTAEEGLGVLDVTLRSEPGGTLAVGVIRRTGRVMSGAAVRG